MGDEAKQRRTGGLLTWLLALAGVGLVVIGLVAWWGGAEQATTRAGPPTPGATQDGPEPPPEERVAREPGSPELLTIPALGIRADVVPVAAPGGVLTPPADASVLGWWADGARPGAGRGSALVAGHTVHTGGGALDDLERVAQGDLVWVRTDQARLGYEVRDRVVLGKGELAQQAETLFDQQVPGRLVLVTCEDWNGEEYLSNVVVTAEPAA